MFPGLSFTPYPKGHTICAGPERARTYTNEDENEQFKLSVSRKEYLVKRKELIPPTKLSKSTKHPPNDDALVVNEASNGISLTP